MSLPRQLVVGIGSPHGDDQAGWRVAERLAAEVEQNAIAVRKASSPIELLDWLDNVERLVICDACRGLGCAGELRRWVWPTAEIPTIAWSGTHDLSLPAVLTLAERLGRLPEHVVLWGIEGAFSVAIETLSTEAAEAIPALVSRIVGEFRDPA